MDKIYLLDGGIGDFLQCIPFINAGKHNNVKYGVITHLLNASKFFEAIGVKPEFIYTHHMKLLSRIKGIL